ncbi:MAG: hypothetical protein DMG06_06250 [Acidobacteria bacterium]|nr:MAG: hypothetical protein DMG06_06250 [Acidobacteriota bacterium]
MSYIYELLHQGKAYFQAKEYEACMIIMSEVLREDPANTEAAWLMKEAQRQWEEQRSLEEFEIYVENLKKEAMDLFDQEQYEQCLGMFRFLLELEPDNHTLCNYLELSQQMFLEMIERRSPAAEPSPPAVPTEIKTEELRATESEIDRMDEVPSCAAASMPASPPAPEFPATPVLDSSENPLLGGEKASAFGVGPPVRHNPPLHPSGEGESFSSFVVPPEVGMRGSSEKGSQAGFTASGQQIQDAQSTPLVGSGLETITESKKQQIIEQYLASTTRTKRKWRRIVWLSASALLLATTVAAGLWLYPLLLLTSSLDIQSNPEGASVFVNNQLKGQTHFRQERIPAGSYELRVEKEGYTPYSQKLVVGKAQSDRLLLQLEKLRVDPEPITQSLLSQETGPATPSSGAVSLGLQPEGQAPSHISVETEPKEVQDPPQAIVASVIHYHLRGSCTGRLKIDGNVISFSPVGDSNDGFSQNLSEIDSAKLNDNLVIQFNDKTYEFDTLAKNRQENHRKLETFYQQIKRPIAKVK